MMSELSYKVLGISEEASMAEVKHAYLVLLQQYSAAANNGDRIARELRDNVQAAYNEIGEQRLGKQGFINEQAADKKKQEQKDQDAYIAHMEERYKFWKSHPGAWAQESHASCDCAEVYGRDSSTYRELYGEFDDERLYMWKKDMKAHHDAEWAKKEQQEKAEKAEARKLAKAKKEKKAACLAAGVEYVEEVEEQVAVPEVKVIPPIEIKFDTKSNRKIIKWILIILPVWFVILCIASMLGFFK